MTPPRYAAVPWCGVWVVIDVWRDRIVSEPHPTYARAAADAFLRDAESMGRV